MALDATNALVDLQEAKAFLLNVGTSDDAMIEAAINAASLTVQSYCNRLLKKRTVTAERVEGPNAARLWLEAVPVDIASAVTVSVDDTAQTVWKQESDGLQSAFDVIVRPDHLYRRDGWRPTSTDPYNVLLTYTGGFTAATMPTPVKEACLYVVQKLFRDSHRQLAEVAQINTPMGGISILDSALPRMARLLLDPYRLRMVA